MKMKKDLYTRQVENLKWWLGQKRVSRWTENPKGRSRQKLGIKASHYVSLDHLATRLRYRLSSSNDTNQSDLPSTKQQSDEIAQRHKGNSRVGTQCDYSHNCFSLFFTNCINSVFRRRSLTRKSASLYKTPIKGQFQKSIQVIFTKLQFDFSFFCFVLRRTSNVHF